MESSGVMDVLPWSLTKRRRITAALRGLFVLAGLSCSLSAGCTGTFRHIHSSRELGPGQRLLFGEVITEQSQLPQYVRLLYDRTEVVFDRTLPQYAPESYAALDSIGYTGDVVDRRGGAFVVAAPQSEVYLLGVRIRGTGVAEAIHFVLLRASIAATTTRCVYVGSIVLHATESGIRAEIQDDLQGALHRSHGAVSGCAFDTELAEPVPPPEEEF